MALPIALDNLRRTAKRKRQTAHPTDDTHLFIPCNFIQKSKLTIVFLSRLVTGKCGVLFRLKSAKMLCFTIQVDVGSPFSPSFTPTNTFIFRRAT
jgi:hypothetical protein